MMKHSFYLTLLIAGSAFAKTQPNVLWVLTDDHRYDSIRAFNQMMTGDEMSPLGYVESPSTDKLAEMGTTFINTYCHAQGCAPSRASMHLGRYPFRSGIYEFEWFNKDTEHWKPSLPEQMAALGYQTFHVGKLGVRVRTTNRNGKFGTHQIYQQDISFHRMFDEGLTGWSKGEVTEVAGIKLDKPTHCDWLRTLEGTWEYTGYELNKIAGLENHSKQVEKNTTSCASMHLRRKNSRAMARSSAASVPSRPEKTATAAIRPSWSASWKTPAKHWPSARRPLPA